MRRTAPPHILYTVAAKNKSKGRPSRDSGPPGPHEIVLLHMEASRRRDELLEEARELQSAGKIREARRLLAQAEAIHEHLTALENECRNSRPERSHDT